MRMRMQTTSKAGRMWDYPAPVGRRPRRAHGLANSLGPDRAGFEPCRGSSFAHEKARPQTLGSKRFQKCRPHPAAQIRRGVDAFRDSENLGRAEIFALPLLEYEPRLT